MDRMRNYQLKEVALGAALCEACKAPKVLLRLDAPHP
jgi:hypothetical protein